MFSVISSGLSLLREGASRIRTEAARSDAEVRIRAKDAKEKRRMENYQGPVGVPAADPFRLYAHQDNFHAENEPYRSGQ
jgi:hypothetical protein